jgi:aminopeptidase N
MNKLILFLVILLFPFSLFAQTPQPTPDPNALDGSYGPYRANNDLLYYHLDIRVDPAKKWIGGKTTVRFKMLKDDNRIQLDLSQDLKVDKIMMHPAQRSGFSNERGPLIDTQLKYRRDKRSVFIDFPELLKAGKIYDIDFYYSGNPPATGRFGCITFKKDPAGRDWVNTACEGPGASIWWPNKDHWRDEVENMRISVAVPNNLSDISNGHFAGKTDLGDGYTRWDWDVSYPINNYCVSLNIGTYEHWSEKHNDLNLDYYVLPENIAKAKAQFSQVPEMIDAYEHYFGEYPFKKDGYKLIEAPYSGMEHQSAVTYGNHWVNGYLERDWTGVGISPKFDFIIIHESGHEWFGNAVSAADNADMWIHEGWTTYLECLYVEYRWGKADGLKYTNAYKSKVQNKKPIVGERGTGEDPPQDQYFKGALFLNTMRSVVEDDKKWFALIKGLYNKFKYHNIMTEDVAAFFSAKIGRNMTPIFDEYLRHAALPALELKFENGEVSYRWQADEKGFDMPVKVGSPANWQTIKPTTEWQKMKTSLSKDDFQVATDLYFVDVKK